MAVPRQHRRPPRPHDPRRAHGTAASSPSAEPVPQRPHPRRGRRVAPWPPAASAVGQPDRPGHVLRPAAPLPLLSTAVLERLESARRRRPPARRRPKARPACGRPPTPGRPRPVASRQVEIRRRLHRVGVHARARAPAGAPTSTTSANGWTTPVSLLAVITDDNGASRRDRQSAAKRVQVDHPSASTGTSRTLDARRAPAARGRLAHRRVLDRRRRHDGLAPRSPSAASSVPARPGCRPRSPGGEDDLGGSRARGRRPPRLAGLLEQRAGPAGPAGGSRSGCQAVRRRTAAIAAATSGRSGGWPRGPGRRSASAGPATAESSGDPDRLGVAELLDAELGQLTAVARALDPAEGHLGHRRRPWR